MKNGEIRFWQCIFIDRKIRIWYTNRAGGSFDLHFVWKNTILPLTSELLSANISKVKTKKERWPRNSPSASGEKVHIVFILCRFTGEMCVMRVPCGIRIFVFFGGVSHR